MAVWPTGVSADADLFILKNNLSTTLNGAIDASTTTVVLTDASAFPTAGYVTIDTEAIKYTGVSTNTLTGVTRGADGTTAAIHSTLAPVFHLFVANHHNVLKDEIKALETSLDLTASRAIATNGSGRLAAATTTATELGYVNGVTSAIQTQLNAKAPAASPTFSGTVTTPVTASRAVVTGTSSELAASAVTATELGYVSGVTSAIQTQISNNASGNRVLISTQTASNSATIDFTGLSSTYYKYVIEVSAHRPATTNTDQWIRLSTDNGSSYISSGYYYGLTRVGSSGSGGFTGAAAQAQIVFAIGHDNTANDASDGYIEVYNPSQTTAYHKVMASLTYVDNAGVVTRGDCGGLVTNSSAVNAIRIMSASGNITSGTYKLYGIKAA